MEEKKEEKLKDFIILILSAIIVALIGIRIYETYIRKDKPKENKNTVEKTTKKANDKNKDDEINKLHNNLITSNKDYGMYFINKVDSEKTDDINFIKFNVYNYVLENNIDYKMPEAGVEISEENTYFISKDTINNYINSKYNNDLKYNTILSDDVSNGYNIVGIYQLVSTTDKWGIMSVAKSGGESYIKAKMIKNEKDGDYLYIYDNAVVCYKYGDYPTCAKAIDDNENVFNCEEDGSCPEEISEVANYALEKISDLNTFKHTFKKGTDNNYYYLSTEIIEGNL